MAMSSEPRHLRIREKSVELDGQEIAGSLTQVELVADGRQCQAVLHLVPNHVLDVDLMASVAVAKESCAAEIRRFLEQADPARLEQEALSRVTTGSLTSVMLDVLKEWADGWEG